MQFLREDCIRFKRQDRFSSRMEGRVKNIAMYTRDEIIDLAKQLQKNGFSLAGPFIEPRLGHELWPDLEERIGGIAYIKGDFSPPTVGDGPFVLAVIEDEKTEPYLDRFYKEIGYNLE